MNYFEIMAYSNIALCILVAFLIIIEIFKMFFANKNTEENIFMSCCEIHRELMHIKNKLDNK